MDILASHPFEGTYIAPPPLSDFAVTKLETLKPRRTLRFLLDENMSENALDLFKEMRIGVLHIRQVGMRGAPDQEVFDFACMNGFVLVTHDRDFERYMDFDYRGSPGTLLLFQTGNKDKKALKARKRALLHFYTSFGQWTTGANGLLVRYFAKDYFEASIPDTVDARRPLQTKSGSYKKRQQEPVAFF